MNLNLESNHKFLSTENITVYLFLSKHSYLGNIHYSNSERYIFNNSLFKDLMQEVRRYNFNNEIYITPLNVLQEENFNKFTSYLLQNNKKFKENYKGVTD